jgi:hypothetical protein
MKKLLIVAGCLLASCASKPVWTHPTKDSSEWKVDAADCERFFGGSDQAQLTCLTQKGWRRTR